ncbi:FHIPEP family type III secretion protein, partial [Candidatus Aerophobetes bacterium]|nr:FHIPEP family type III secretion protein [Candidatus Aerophobetes bacterium]
ERITSIRRQIALDMGIIVPPVRIRDNIQLKPNEYKIKIKGTEIAQGELMIKYYLAMDTGAVTKSVEGIKTKEPAFGLPAIWVKENQKQEAEASGYTVVNATSVFITHLTEVIKSYSYELIGRQEVQNLVDNLKRDYPAVVEELIPNLMSIGEIQKVLQNLLRERVSIRNLLTILETLADWAPQTKNIDFLTEYVRQALARSLCEQYQDEEGKISVITLDPVLEQKISQSIEHKERTSYIHLEPEIIQKIISNLTPLVKKARSLNYQPIILTSPNVRPYFKRITERFLPSLVVLSYNEVTPEIKIKSIGALNI